MEQLPNEVLLKIFSYLEVQDLGRCATLSKRFQKIAYEKSLWQKLPINLYSKLVPIGFIQHIVEHGTAYLNLDMACIVGYSLVMDKNPTFFKTRVSGSTRVLK